MSLSCLKLGIRRHLMEKLVVPGILPAGTEFRLQDDGQPPVPFSGLVFGSLHGGRIHDLRPEGGYYRWQSYGFDVTISVKTTYLQRSRHGELSIDRISDGLHTMVQSIVEVVAGRIDAINSANSVMQEQFPDGPVFLAGKLMHLSGHTNAIPRGPEWWGKNTDPHMLVPRQEPFGNPVPMPVGRPNPEGYSFTLSFDGAEIIAPIGE